MKTLLLAAGLGLLAPQPVGDQDTKLAVFVQTYNLCTTTHFSKELNGASGSDPFAIERAMDRAFEICKPLVASIRESYGDTVAVRTYIQVRNNLTDLVTGSR